MKLDTLKEVTNFEVKIVELKDTAKKIGSGSAEVFATPAMIALMEKTAFNSIENILPKGFTSVGIQLNVSHTKASLPGSVINCKSEVIKIEGKKIYFTINASDENGEIGIAEHIRYVVNSKEFTDSIKK